MRQALGEVGEDDIACLERSLEIFTKVLANLGIKETVRAVRIVLRCRSVRIGDDTELPHQAHRVEMAAELDDLVPFDAVEDDPRHSHVLACGWDTLQLAFVRAPPRPALGDAIPFGN